MVDRIEPLDFKLARVAGTCVRNFDNNQLHRLKQFALIQEYMQRTTELHDNKHSTAKVPGIAGMFSAGGMVLTGINPFGLDKKTADMIGSVFANGIQGVSDTVTRIKDSRDITTEGNRAITQMTQQQLASTETTSDNRLAAVYKAFSDAQAALNVQTR